MTTATTPKRLTKKQEAEQEQQEAITKLRAMCPPGTKVYVMQRHRARSGMLRHLSLFILTRNEEKNTVGIEDITWLARRAIGWPMADDGGIKVSGCGMDMHFHLVYTLSAILYRDGFTCPGKETCPRYLSDHPKDDTGERTYGHTIHHDSGGYAIDKESL